MKLYDQYPPDEHTINCPGCPICHPGPPLTDAEARHYITRIIGQARRLINTWEEFEDLSIAWECLDQLDSSITAYMRAWAHEETISPLPAFEIVSWDHRQQPDWAEVQAAISIYKEPYIHVVNTGEDQYAILVSDLVLTEAEVQACYEEWVQNG